ncbi:hypothetical protein FBPa45_0099 [Pseudomonas phage vB_PaeS_FBPa45]|nr:hypothetical protein FBPa45_0099 [Pseudomonas phage vB_PaeS_FBPa45]
MSDVLEPFYRTGRTTRALHYVAMCAVEGQKIAFHCPNKESTSLSVQAFMGLLCASFVRYEAKQLDKGYLFGTHEITVIDDVGRPRGSVAFFTYRNGSLGPDGNPWELSEFKNVFDPSCFEQDPRLRKILYAYHAFDDQNETTTPRNVRNAMSAQKGLRGNSSIRDDGAYWERRIVRKLAEAGVKDVVPGKNKVDDIGYGHRFSIPFNAATSLSIPDEAAKGEYLPDWQACLGISNEPPVHEALSNFSEDQTENNAVCVIRAIVTSIRARIFKAFP